MLPIVAKTFEKYQKFKNERFAVMHRQRTTMTVQAAATIRMDRARVIRRVMKIKRMIRLPIGV